MASFVSSVYRSCSLILCIHLNLFTVRMLERENAGEKFYTYTYNTWHILSGPLTYGIYNCMNADSEWIWWLEKYTKKKFFFFKQQFWMFQVVSDFWKYNKPDCMPFRLCKSFMIHCIYMYPYPYYTPIVSSYHAYTHTCTLYVYFIAWHFCRAWWYINEYSTQHTCMKW